jgi:hypothetical protein
MRERIFLGLLGLLAAAAIAGGCGGGGEAEPLSRAAFVKQGNAICLQAGEERGSALKEAASDGEQDPASSGEAELEEFVTEIALPPIEQMTEELDDLGVPKGDEKQVAAIVGGLERGIAQLEADPSSAMTDAPFAAANRMAQAYGLAACTI